MRFTLTTSPGTGSMLSTLFKCSPPSRCLSGRQETAMNVFDRSAKRKQRDRAAANTDFDYIREEFGWRISDRLYDVKRKFDVAVDLGCGRGFISRHVYDDKVGLLYQMDMSQNMLEQAQKSPEVPTINILGDEEYLPFKPKSVDLFTSSLSMHWVNDLPGAFRQIRETLKDDGCFIGSIFGGDTLFELRVALQLAELERQGGFAPHVSPFTTVQDLGNLLSRSGFVMTAMDIDDFVVGYPSIFELMVDLQGMAENNCSWSRRLRIPPDTLMAAAAIYEEMFAKPGENGVPATFQVLNFIGWTPHPSQKGPAKRGSGKVHMGDIDKLDQLKGQIDNLKAENASERIDKSADELSKQLEKLMNQGRTKSPDKDDEGKK